MVVCLFEVSMHKADFHYTAQPQKIIELSLAIDYRLGARVQFFQIEK